MITITDSAAEKVLDILASEPQGTKLRAFVQGGGCSGFQYGFSLDDEVAEDDFEVQHPLITVLVDAMSFQYLDGATIDYKEDLMSSSFVISNPNASSSCGCGASFSV